MKNKKVIFSVLILCLLSGICFYCFRKPVKNNITLYGNVDIRNVNLAFRIGGRIKEMIYDEGDVIKNGDIIAELDEQPIRNKFNQAVAKLDQAKANAQNANRYYNRNISLCRAGKRAGRLARLWSSICRNLPSAESGNCCQNLCLRCHG